MRVGGVATKNSNQPNNIRVKTSALRTPAGLNNNGMEAAPFSNEIANKSLYLHWKYHPAGLQRDTLRAIFDATLKDCNPFKKGMTIAMS